MQCSFPIIVMLKSTTRRFLFAHYLIKLQNSLSWYNVEVAMCLKSEKLMEKKFIENY